MPIISIANFKGGVGKTTSTVNIGAGLVRYGKRVLLVDMDPQFNLTQSLEASGSGPTVYDLLTGRDQVEPVQIHERLDVLPASLELIKAEIELAGMFKREYIAEGKIKPYAERYDYTLIDCPPSLGLLTVNAFMASDLIFAPVESQFLSLQGFKILTEAVGNIGLEIDRAFVTKYNSRRVLDRTVTEKLRQQIDGRLFDTVIRENIALAEAPIKRQTIFEYAPNSYGARDYSHLAFEILNL